MSLMPTPTAIYVATPIPLPNVQLRDKPVTSVVAATTTQLCVEVQSPKGLPTALCSGNRGAPKVTEVPEEVDHPVTPADEDPPVPPAGTAVTTAPAAASPAAPPTVHLPIGTAANLPPSGTHRTASRSSLQSQQIALKPHLNPKVPY